MNYVVVKIMAPFWVPIIIRHLSFRVPQKGTIILTTNYVAHRCCCKPRCVVGIHPRWRRSALYLALLAIVATVSAKPTWGVIEPEYMPVLRSPYMPLHLHMMYGEQGQNPVEHSFFKA